MTNTSKLHITGAHRHTHIPYLWRAVCTCGWSALAPSEARAQAAAQFHFESEEPFPYDLTPEDPTHGRNDK